MLCQKERAAHGPWGSVISALTRTHMSHKPTWSLVRFIPVSVQWKRTNMLGFSTLKLNPSYTLLPLTTTLTLSLPCLWKEPGLTGSTCSTFAKTQILQTQLAGLLEPKKAGVFQASWCYKPEGAQALGRLVGCTLTGLLAKRNPHSLHCSCAADAGRSTIHPLLPSIH